MTIRDLFEFRLSDETLVTAWEDEDTTYLQIRFVTLAIPTELFNELIQGLKKHTKSLKKNSMVV